MLPILLVAAVALQTWAWRSLQRRVVAGVLTKLAAIFRYGAWALAPLLLWAGLFLGAVAAEELTGEAVIPELYGRAALPVAVILLAVAGLGWLSFLMACGLFRRGPSLKA